MDVFFRSSDDIFLIIGILSMIICLLSCKKGIYRPVSFILCSMVIVLTALNIFLFSLNSLDGFDKAVYVQIRQGLRGAPMLEFFRHIFLFLSIVFISILSCLMCLKYCKKWDNTRITKVVIIFQVFTLLGHPLLYEIYSTVYAGDELEIAQKKFYTQKKGFEFPQKNFNVVWIYAESFEETFFNEDIFPNLLPNLTKIKEQSLSFSNIAQAKSSGSTITGLVASQCGALFHFQEKMDEKFLPDNMCFGDILDLGGYASVFMQGATKKFANHDKFFQTHNIELIALEELRNHVEKKDILAWGLTDDKLFEFALKKYENLSVEDKPFFLGISTIDTHFPNGYIPRKYKDVRYGDGSNPILNAIHVSDKVITDFIKEIQSSKNNHKNTIIIVSSDHLMKQSSATKLLDSIGHHNRRNLLFFILPSGFKKESINTDKAGTTLDSGVTTLDLMGINIRKNGLGRSLIRKEKTLIEEIGASSTIFGIKNASQSKNKLNK